MDSRQSHAQRQGVDANSIGAGKRVSDDINRLCMTLQRLEGESDVLSSPDIERKDFEAERAGRRLNLV